MRLKSGRTIYWATVVLFGFAVLGLISCASTTVTKETEYTPGGNVNYSKDQVNNDVMNELRRVFTNTKIEGIGIFESDNESLARRQAINLAVNDMASKVQVKTRSESVIMNSKDVRDLVENQVHALISGYKVESEGYDPGTTKYRVRISVEGEQLIREIEKKLIK
jgi:hypothetical protein